MLEALHLLRVQPDSVLVELHVEPQNAPNLVEIGARPLRVRRIRRISIVDRRPTPTLVARTLSRLDGRIERQLSQRA